MSGMLLETASLPTNIGRDATLPSEGLRCAPPKPHTQRGPQAILAPRTRHCALDRERRCTRGRVR
jgi:hypothetical protein